MAFGVLRKLVGDPNERALKQIAPLVREINDLEPEIEALGDEELRARTDSFRARLRDGEALDDMLAEALAVAREAVRRHVGERAYDVQLTGAVALHRGNVAEMRTGEGKTLVATLALYANALEGKGAHLVTVNDYLAGREPQWYGPALDALGLSLGVIQNEGAFIYSREPVSEQPGRQHLLPVPRREAYQTDVTYGTNNEFGFDYLRDNMVQVAGQRVQRGRHYAIVDEADSVLIDEARTPLIISGPQQDDLSLYPRFNALVPRLQRDVHYTVEERTRSVHLTEAGIEVLERGLGIDNIFSAEHFRLTRYMEAALKAHIIYQRDREYVVKDGRVVIVDEFTGRLMEGRRWSDGLHQAVEAKEGVKIQQESVTYATITLQNFFRLYEKLAGMTGTAVTDAEELHEIYGLEVIVVPTNLPMVRDDFADLVFRSQREKFAAVIDDVMERHGEDRPVLVGTVSIEDSEQLADLLRRRGVDHEVLNAKQHQREAAIVARAGQPGAVTIATNMAGRGTDIKLGDGVADNGGLHIIGTERHESRRVDNQLRGRSGRQGDPGSSRFYVSFEDDVMRRFAPDWMPNMMSKLGMSEGVPLESKMVTRAIESAQSRVEAYHFDTRKHVVDYDDVMNQHRDVIYGERNKVLAGESMRESVLGMVHDEIEGLAKEHLDDAPADPDAFFLALQMIVPLRGSLTLDDVRKRNTETLLEEIGDLVEERYEELEDEVGEEAQRHLERFVLLRTIDMLWVQHLTAVAELRQGIGLRAYGQANPLVAYKREAHDMWEQLLGNIRAAVARQIFHARPVAQPRVEPVVPQNALATGPGDPDGAGEDDGGGVATATRRTRVRKVGRNAPCPCGSGKKYKRCCGASL
ncbi:MAG: preprotein translocase subunit SecA [Chloroflexi bacterium]|nr:preprotein translocase subunit SecA [Chloroflexota bacterium]